MVSHHDIVLFSVQADQLFLLIFIQARKYFQSLSAQKTPVRGTQGERYRQKQLIRQLPAYDVDTIYCNERTEAEMKQMELFIKLRKEKFLGRGGLKMREATDRSAPWVCLIVSPLITPAP